MRVQHNVLHVIFPQPPGMVGGSDLHIADLAEQQLTNSVFHPLILMFRSEEYAIRLQHRGIPYIPGHLLESNRISLARELLYLTRSHKIDLIHSHGYDSNYLVNILRLLLSRTWGSIPSVMTCHGWIETSIRLRLKTWFDILALHNANSIIVCDARQATRLRANGIKVPIEYIPNGIRLPSAMPNSDDRKRLKSTLGIPESAKLIATVGRLSTEKRIDLFIESCKKIAHSKSNTHFLIVGSGPERTLLEQIAMNIGIHSKITFTGLLTDIDALYRGIDVFILTSDTEGSPRTLLEAMANGIASVATSVGGINKIIDHGLNGYLAEKRDTEQIAYWALRLLSDDTLRAVIGSRAREKVQQFFAIDKMCKSVEQVYWETLARR